MNYPISLVRLAGPLAAIAVPAVHAAPQTASGPAVAGVEPLSVLLALLLVVALILALGWLLRRSGLPLGGGAAGRVLASLPLGGRERAVLIEIGGEQLLLGVSPGQVRLLVRFEAPVFDAAPAPGEFAARLRQWLEPGRRE